MGLETNSSAGKTYLSIADGKFVRQFKEANSNTTQRINKNGKVVHEQFFDALVMTVTGIEKRENDYGVFLEIIGHDGSDNFQISTQFSGRYSGSFLKALPSCDASQPIRIFPWSMVDKNDPTKKVTGITLYQNDGDGYVKVTPFFTKEDSKGLPPMVQVTVKGKTVWDDTAMMDFLFDSGKKALAMDSIRQAVTDGKQVNENDPPF